jgi:NAD(P)-dependent dehydrogenase (short-subunit alcohol dehydrogenase family)
VRKRVADQPGRVDILVSNAAIFESNTWDELDPELDPELWQRVMSANLNAPMLMCKAFMPLMRGRGCGHVLTWPRRQSRSPARYRSLTVPARWASSIGLRSSAAR